MSTMNYSTVRGVRCTDYCYQGTWVLTRFGCVWLLWPCGLQPARLLHAWDSLGEDTGVGCYAQLLDIFLTQGLNLHHWQVGSLPRAPPCFFWVWTNSKDQREIPSIHPFNKQYLNLFLVPDAVLSDKDATGENMQDFACMELCTQQKWER